MILPSEKTEFLQQLSQIHTIPFEELTKYYEQHFNDPLCVQAFPSEVDRYDYIDTLIITHIAQFHSSVVEEFEVFVISSSRPREARKSGNIFNNHVVLAKRPQPDARAKLMNIVNLGDSGIVTHLKPLSTGKIKVNISEETENTISAFSRESSEFIEQDLTWIPKTESEKVAYVAKLIKKVDIKNAGKNLSAKDDKGRVNNFSLRMIQGIVSSHRIGKKEDEDTKVEREYGIIGIVDKSVALDSEFFKTKTIPDPKNVGKTITKYGGFSGFCDPDDIRTLGKGSEARFIGYITGDNNMNITTVLPMLSIAPKKPTERLQKNQATGTLGQDPSKL